MAQPKKNDEIVEIGEQLLKELEMLRKLSILEMFERGFSQAEIADVLGVSQPTISRMFPKGIPKKQR